MTTLPRIGLSQKCGKIVFPENATVDERPSAVASNCPRSPRLTNARFLFRVLAGVVRRPFFVGRWEVVQSVVHQTLDLIILVRVQASQPKLNKLPISQQN
jgi:hypothetical protein